MSQAWVPVLERSRAGTGCASLKWQSQRIPGPINPTVSAQNMHTKNFIHRSQQMQPAAGKYERDQGCGILCLCLSPNTPVLCSPLKNPLDVMACVPVDPSKAPGLPRRQSSTLGPTREAKHPQHSRAPSLGLLHLAIQSRPADPYLGSWLILLPSIPPSFCQR